MSEHQAHGRAFQVGDRVLVTGGYQNDPEWLHSGGGYIGNLVQVSGIHAVVELEGELSLTTGRPEGWAYFGTGSATERGRLTTASGRWLVLTRGWSGWEWREPTGRLH